MRYPWWSWCNLLALDAPLVALAWQETVAASAAITLPWAMRLVLGCTVWAVYLGDRIGDCHAGRADTLRHQFARANAPLVGILAISTLIVALVGSTALPSPVQVAGWLLGIALAGYLAAIHGLGWRSNVGKCFVVGFLFALGVGTVLLAESVPGHETTWPLLLGMALLATLNCLVIARVEDAELAPSRRSGHLVACAVVVLSVGNLSVGWLLAPAVVALLLLDRWHSWPNECRRVLADGVLLWPIVAVQL